MLFSASHLILRNGKYHFKMRVPSEFVPVFGIESIRKSLRTSDEKEAKRSAEIILSKVRASFDLIRSGALSEEQTTALVGTFKPNRVAKSKKPRLLSHLINLYTIEHSPNWKPKTIDEYDAQFRLLLSIIGDGPVDGYGRGRCLECRNGFIAKGLAPKTTNK